MLSEQELSAMVNQRLTAIETKHEEEMQEVARASATVAAKATAKRYEDRIKDMEAKLVDAQRPDYAPGVPRTVRRQKELRPLSWAVKAVVQNPNGSVILTDTDDGGLSFVGSGSDAAVKAFQASCEDAFADVENGVVYGVKAGMETTSGSAIGEHFVPRIQSDRVIEALYAESIVGQLPGVDKYPMPGLVCDAPSIGSFTAGWSAENASATAAGDATTGRKTLIAKNLTALATLSNQLLTDSNPQIEKYVREGLAQAIGETYDTGAFNGSGSNGQPTGLLNESNTTATAIGSDNVYVAVLKAIARLATAKVPVKNIAVIMHPMVAVKALTTQVGSSGDYIGRSARSGAPFTANGDLGRLLSEALGVPVFLTPVLPVATGTASSTVLVLHCPSWTVGTRQELEIASSAFAGSAFANNQTLIRAITRVDFNLKRAVALEKITGVTH